jgi:hypothetical protein
MGKQSGKNNARFRENKEELYIVILYDMKNRTCHNILNSTDKPLLSVIKIMNIYS